MIFKEPYQESAARLLIGGGILGMGRLTGVESAVLACAMELLKSGKHPLKAYKQLFADLGLPSDMDTLRNTIEWAICLIARNGSKHEIRTVYDNLPRFETTRSASQVAMQQYSTTLLIAHIAGSYIAAHIDKQKGFEPEHDVRILEPTCGVGILAAPLIGMLGRENYAAEITAAEYDPRRREIFEKTFDQAIFSDVNEIFDAYAGRKDLLFDAAVMNPPFGNRQGKTNFDHWCILKCLGLLNEGAPFAAIIGGHTQFNARGIPGDYDFFNQLFSQTRCTVYDSFINYKMGTSYPYRLILGRRTGIAPSAKLNTVPRQGSAFYGKIGMDSWDNLENIIQDEN